MNGLKPVIRVILLGVFLLLMMTPVTAQTRPFTNVFIVMSPNTQLTSIDTGTPGVLDGGDDFRFVDMNFYATGNVQFWAVRLTCTIGNMTQLELVDPDTTDSEANINIGTAWYPLNQSGGDVTHFPATIADTYKSPGTFTVTITRLGADALPIGINGVTTTQHLLQARFRVKPLSANATITPICSVMEFYNRDGVVVIRGLQTQVGALSLRVGYALSGVARRQGSTRHNNIKVTCFNDPSGTNTQYGPVYTDALGNFRFGGATNTLNSANVLRNLGLYRCDFISEYTTQTNDTSIFEDSVFFYLSTSSYQLLPVILRPGDFVDNGFIDGVNDLAVITSNFGLVRPAFTLGDANGTGNVNDADIVLYSSNALLSEPDVVGAGESPLTQNLILSMARNLDPTQVFPNSRIWLGNAVGWQVESVQVTSEFTRASLNRDFWAQLSPTGAEFAYVSFNKVTNLTQLMIGNTTTGMSTVVRMPAGFNLNALAPSWSPDGTRIAFVCSTSANQLLNSGDICILNRNDLTGNSLQRLGVSSKIFPPAWFPYGTNGQVLIYGANDGKIHMYDFANNAPDSIIPIFENNAGDILDMPIITQYWNNSTYYLSYRYDDNDSTFDPVIRMGTIAYDIPNLAIANTSGVLSTLTPLAHAENTETAGVDYYDVSSALNLVWYTEYNYSPTNAQRIQYARHIVASTLTWSPKGLYYIDGYVGNIITDVNGAIWTPYSSTGTLLHAQRATFDYVP